jgi:hypothetical protein
MENKKNDTWKHDFPLTLAEAEVVLASLREQEYWSLRERNANNELIEDRSSTMTNNFSQALRSPYERPGALPILVDQDRPNSPHRGNQEPLSYLPGPSGHPRQTHTPSSTITRCKEYVKDQDIA